MSTDSSKAHNIVKSKDIPIFGIRNLANTNGGSHVTFVDLGFTVHPHDKDAPDKVGTSELLIIRDEPHEDVKKTCVIGLHTVLDLGDVGSPNVTTRVTGGYVHKSNDDKSITNTIKDKGV